MMLDGLRKWLFLGHHKIIKNEEGLNMWAGMIANAKKPGTRLND